MSSLAIVSPRRLGASRVLRWKTWISRNPHKTWRWQGAKHTHTLIDNISRPPSYVKITDTLHRHNPERKFLATIFEIMLTLDTFNHCKHGNYCRYEHNSNDFAHEKVNQTANMTLGLLKFFDKIIWIPIFLLIKSKMSRKRKLSWL